MSYGELWAQAGLAALLHFNSSLADASGNGLTVSSSGLSYVNGRLGGQAGKVSSSGYIQYTNAAALKPTPDFTVGAWVYPAVVLEGETPAIFCSSYMPTTLTSRRGFNLYHDGLEVYTSSGGQVALALPQVLTPNIWAFFVASCTTSRIRLYVNGVMVDEQNGLAVGYGASNYPRVGCQYLVGTGNTNRYSGSIDEAFLFGSELTPAEVRTLFAVATGRYF